MLTADDLTPLSQEDIAGIGAWVQRWIGETDGGVRQRIFFLPTPVKFLALCGAWALDRHNNIRHCELEAGHDGPHRSLAWPYHMSWTGVGTEAKEVEDCMPPQEGGES